MSAWIISQRPGEIGLITDGVTCHVDGTIAEVGTKVERFPELGCVATFRGDTFIRKLTYGAIRHRRFASFDALLAGFMNLHDEIDARAIELLVTLRGGTPEELRRHEFVIAGWSAARQQLEAHVYSYDYHDRGLAPLPPDADGFAIMAAGIGSFAYEYMTEVGASRFHLIVDGVAMMEFFREEISERHGSPIVGGHVELTVVREDGISQEIIHHWPEDMIAQHIEHPQLGERIH